jgi:hypothetical protein
MVYVVVKYFVRLDFPGTATTVGSTVMPTSKVVNEIPATTEVDVVTAVCVLVVMGLEDGALSQTKGLTSTAIPLTSRMDTDAKVMPSAWWAEFW